MKTHLAAASLLASLVAPWLAAGAAHAAEPQDVPTKITAVTVYADRAQVTRTGTIDPPAQPARFVVSGLPGFIDQASVRANLVPVTAGKILDVTVTKTFLAEASEEAVRKADAAVREIEDQLAAIADDERVVNAEIAQLEAIRAFSLEKLPKDMATRDIKVATYADTVDFVSTRLRADRKLLREAAAKRRDLQPELARRMAARNELRARSQLEQSNVVVEVQGSVVRAQLVVSYLTPGATWEPVADLRADGDRSVTVSQFAGVAQTTGEDWTQAALSFATQSPTEMLAVPEAQAMLLGAGGSGISATVQRMGQSFEQAQSAYSSSNMQKGEAWQAQVAQQEVVQARARETFSRLASRGTTAHFEALATRTVRTDGNVVRVPIATATFPMTLRQVAVPEVSLNVVRTAELVNAGEQPLLPGKAALFVDGAFVGTSEMQFVSPGETFSVFLGVNERVKLTRTIDRKKSSLEVGKKRTQAKVSFLLSAENLGDAPVTIELTDRVPVSQTEDIEVSDVSVPKGAKRDSDGLVRWTVTLAGGKRETWRIEYELEYPTGIAQQRPPKASRSAAPAPAEQLMEKIYDFEEEMR
ncbi:MAG: mucoidy inhibitor MuiA family protein [Myxococcales bacterium]|nr:mucoidy inhibitor MuiA family protein [Myxococcales bacterium]MCB9737300.1 mucoidy inhibitor MuiA family protein [Deltaproteobacteria bacterium]